MRRTRKPHVTEKKGHLYFRLRWAEGQKRRERYLPLPGVEDSEEFDREYWAIRSGQSTQIKSAPKTSWGALIRSYRASHSYKKLAPRTKTPYDRVMNQLVEKNAELDIRSLTRAQVRAIHEKYADTPRKADLMVQVIRLLLNYAKNDLEWIESNPADKVKLFGTQKEWQPWPEALQRAFKKACVARGDDLMLTAFHLGTGTGQRAGDLCGMRWDHYDGEYMSVVQDKTGERMWVYCPRELREHLDAIPRRGAFILAKNLTQPLTYAAVEKRFRAARDAIGPNAEGYVMHGWRYTAAVALAEAGCSDAEIQSVTGHRTLEMVQKYRRQAGQRQLSKQAQEKRK